MRRTCTLTQREIQVLAGIARGEENAEIAARLGIALSTVKSHVERMRERHGAPSRSALVRIGYERAWLTALTPEERPPTTLPPRQLQVLQYAAQGLTDEQMARTLGIGAATVSEHIRRMGTALNARTRAHAVALGYQHGHLQPNRIAAAA